MVAIEPGDESKRKLPMEIAVRLQKLKMDQKWSGPPPARLHTHTLISGFLLQTVLCVDREPASVVPFSCCTLTEARVLITLLSVLVTHPVVNPPERLMSCMHYPVRGDPSRGQPPSGQSPSGQPPTVVNPPETQGRRGHGQEWSPY